MSDTTNKTKDKMPQSNFCCGTGSKIQLVRQSCNPHTDKLNAYDWLADLPDNAVAEEMVEVQFKPPRKGYYINSNHLDLHKGDIVAVEANPGHDIGTVTMTGRLVPLQMKKANLKPNVEFKRIHFLPLRKSAKMGKNRHFLFKKVICKNFTQKFALEPLRKPLREA